MPKQYTSNQKLKIKDYTRIVFFLIFLSLLNLDISAQQKEKREMRGVWIATVANIDWPIQQNLSSEEQRKTMISLLNNLEKNNINTIVIQIRPTADAFYFSTIEPWSHWLNGQQSYSNSHPYDPLEFIIQEAHKRFMDVHAWLNPYRVTNSSNTSLLDKNHLFFKQPEMFIKYANTYVFDPGLDATREHLKHVVKDIVSRYDIDAIHFDDYFYPYPQRNLEFDDKASFKKFPRGFLPEQKNDWRRNNVNMIVSELQETIKKAKPWVEFGISPFGVWRNNDVDPKGSATKAGVQNYDDLYADILKWLKEGTIDYVSPQIYWEIGKKNADYQVLAKWWSENAFDKNLYVGLASYKLAEHTQAKPWLEGNELIRQLKENKRHCQIKGAMYFSAKTFIENRCGLNDSLKNNHYRYPALQPINRNIKGKAAQQPKGFKLKKEGEKSILTWDRVIKKGGEEISYYIIYAFKERNLKDLNNPADILIRTKQNFLDLKNLPNGKKLKGEYTFVLTAFNRYKYESIPDKAITVQL